MVRAMKVADTILAVNVKALAVASGVPVRTLYRWAEEDRIPGRDVDAQKFWFDKIKAAARKLEQRESA